MQRALLNDLIKWKSSKNRKPLVLNGARQVGKTWILKEFGKSNFDNVAYISLDNDSVARSFFEDDFNIKRIIESIALHTEVDVRPQKTLIIFDEAQSQPKAITSLKYFYEEAPEYVVVAAGSLLGLQQNEGSGWPVGKVDTLNLYPLSFIEFLDATNNEKFAKLIQDADLQMLTTFKTKIIRLLKSYFIVGGMPAVVNEFVDTNDYFKVRDIQKQILYDYTQDFSKHIPPVLLQRTLDAWNSIPAHLSRENKKFIFGYIKQGARAKQYDETLMWLEKAGLIHKVNRVSKPGIPLKSYADNKSFKVFLLDVGLLTAMTDVSPKIILDRNASFTEFKGALTEQFVCQQLIAQANLEPYYWSARNSIGEVDFLVQRLEQIYPIEVKAEENLSSKSLRAFYGKFDFTKPLRFSMSDYRSQDWIKNVPLYCCMNTKIWDI